MKRDEYEVVAVQCFECRGFFCCRRAVDTAEAGELEKDMPTIAADRQRNRDESIGFVDHFARTERES
jgi:hypothetical protein